MKLFRRLFAPAPVHRPVTLIHTPKCAGTFIQQAYRLHERPWIRTLGHGRLRDAAPDRSHAVVGLIREPGDWYASYVAFCRRSLGAAPQSVENFPATHPISIFSDDGRRGVTATLEAMADRALLQRLCAARVTANVYAREIPDVYEFMLRTGTGFWTWTMMHHYAAVPTEALRTADDVRSQAEAIAARVAFIHQETLCDDVQTVLGLPPPADRAPLNRSERSAQDVPGERARRLADGLDGAAYAILGRRHALPFAVAAVGPERTAPDVARRRTA
jgi:hypothetical protein